jgi:Poly(ADP-ribose) polymerase catalytic domain
MMKAMHYDEGNAIQFQTEEIFKIASDQDAKRFKPHEKCLNRMLLWHELEAENIAKILNHGLPVTDVLNPNTNSVREICFADKIAKLVLHVNYHENQQCILLLLYEVALGEMYEVTNELDQHFEIKNLPQGKN